MKWWFVDTSYIVALANEDDALHDKAVAYADEIEAGGIALLTTEEVLVEVASALARPRFRSHAVAFIDEIRQTATVVPTTRELLAQGWEMYKRGLDKSWSWVDTMSFAVMRAEELTEALTNDRHFEQAGFRALLREEGAK
ncbi:MAG: type II toxin-antitoxin system VapC family toxin [Planctomycetes bacterium]|nr:type II toxin-antitoxin system VapC family toxin [Planctomycetota bacterium]